MSTRTLLRLSGLALLIALPLQVVGFVLHPPSENVADVLKPLYGPAHLVIFISWVLAMLGLPGFYARQAERAGLLGLVGYVLTMGAVAYHLYLTLYEAFPTPLLARQAPELIGPGGPLAHGAGALGPLGFGLVLAFPLFGIATVRAKVYSRWAGWLQVASVVVAFALFPLMPPDAPPPLPTLGISPIAFLYYALFLGYAWGGWALWRGEAREPHREREAIAQPVR
jgi:hypothetical protein